jgi:hypothetical protein
MLALVRGNQIATPELRQEMPNDVLVCESGLRGCIEKCRDRGYMPADPRRARRIVTPPNDRRVLAKVIPQSTPEMVGVWSLTIVALYGI